MMHSQKGTDDWWKDEGKLTKKGKASLTTTEFAPNLSYLILLSLF